MNVTPTLRQRILNREFENLCDVNWYVETEGYNKEKINILLEDFKLTKELLKPTIRVLLSKVRTEHKTLHNNAKAEDYTLFFETHLHTFDEFDKYNVDTILLQKENTKPVFSANHSKERILALKSFLEGKAFIENTTEDNFLAVFGYGNFIRPIQWKASKELLRETLEFLYKGDMRVCEINKIVPDLFTNKFSNPMKLGKPQIKETTNRKRLWSFFRAEFSDLHTKKISSCE